MRWPRAGSAMECDLEVHSLEEAAVDGEVDAVDVAGPSAAEERDRVGGELGQGHRAAVELTPATAALERALPSLNSLLARDEDVDAIARVGVDAQPVVVDAAVAAVDWPHVEHDYRTPGAYDLVTRNLTVVIRGQTFEAHADGLAKIPDALRELFSRLDALYQRSTRPEKR